MRSLDISEKIGMLLGFTVAGLGLLIAGIVSDQIIAISVGGALLGASLSGWISKRDFSRIEQNTMSVLSDTINEKFVSDEKKLRNYRKAWHVYIVSEKNEDFRWYHNVLDFRNILAVGSLRGRTTESDKSGEKIEYDIDGGFRDQRLVFFKKAKDSDEPTSIHVFPLLGESFHTLHCGFSIIKTWDGNSALVPTILSRTELKENQEELDEKWKKEFKNLHKLLPRIYS